MYYLHRKLICAIKNLKGKFLKEVITTQKVDVICSVYCGSYLYCSEAEFTCFCQLSNVPDVLPIDKGTKNLHNYTK